MTVTITLTPKEEADLRDKAKRDGRDADSVAHSVLAQALAWEAKDAAEAMAGITAGLDAVVAGRFRSFSAFEEEQRAKYSIGKQR